MSNGVKTIAEGRLICEMSSLSDMDVALVWGRITGEAERAGVSRPIADSLIAATALVHDMTVVTRNVSDMVYTGVRLFNPFE